MVKYLLIVTINLSFAISSLGQLHSTIEKQLPVIQANKSVNQLVILPISLEKKLTKLQVMLDNEKSFDYKTYSFKEFLNKARLLRVAEYIKFVGKRKTENGFIFGPSVSHREWYPCIEVAGKKYVFTEGNVETDTEIFNLSLKEANLKIENEKEAEDLTNLYFAATRGYFENKGKLILSSIEDVPLPRRKAKEAETKRLQKIFVPKTKLIAEGYEVELYTWEMALGEVKKWNFKIQPDAHIEVQSEVIGKL